MRVELNSLADVEKCLRAVAEDSGAVEVLTQRALRWQSSARQHSARGSCLAISMHFNFCRFSSSVPVERAHSSTCNAHIAAQCQVPLRCLATSGSDAQSRARHLRVRSAGRSSGSLGCWQVVRVKNGLCEGHDSWFTAGFRVRARALADGRVYEVLLCGVPCAVVVSVSASVLVSVFSLPWATGGVCVCGRACAWCAAT